MNELELLRDVARAAEAFRESDKAVDTARKAALARFQESRDEDAFLDDPPCRAANDLHAERTARLDQALARLSKLYPPA
jgi:hypothetical protein